MSDSPPRGKELKLARKMYLLVGKLKCNIEIRAHRLCDHTIEGVRCNGHQQLNTIPRDLNDLREHLSDCQIVRCNLEEYMDEVACVLIQCEDDFDKDFLLCSACEGEGGSGICGARDDPWLDCKRCKGRGSVPGGQ